MITQDRQSFRINGAALRRQPRAAFALFIVLLLPTVVSAASMKLVAPNTGWAAYDNRLYWTYDNGASWTDITPVLPDVRRAAIRSVHPPFFRDKSEGWSIIEYHKEAGSPTTVEPAYSVAHTINGGASWSFTELIYPQLPKWNLVQDAVAAPASLFFIDSLHGWLNIPFAGLSKPGKLLATVDGGNSWSWVNSAGVTGGIVFATLQDGWQFDFTADELYVTHDGCKTWEKVSGVATPPQLSPGTQPRLQGVPIFQDQYKGYLAVQYPGTNSGPTKLVIYSTANTGKSWQLAKVLDRAPEGTDAIFDIVDSTAIVSTGSGATDFSVVPVPLNGRTSDVAASDRGIASLKFADSQNGWILTTPYRILATQNGGANWKDITPLSAAAPVRTTTVPISQHELTSVATSTGALASGLSASASIYGSATHVSKHLGFDMSFVRSTADMSTWWKYSPYYDPYIYLWDNLNRAKQDSNLNSGWVTQVENQGWGVVPIWVGRQAPIGCAVPSTTTYKYYIDAATAAAEGKSEADAAASAASGLGLSNTIIYKDIENYDTTQLSQCSNPVISFISAWVSEVHAKGYSAGVYANPLPANQDIGSVSPLPDEIWVGKYDNNATIWDLATLLNTPWVKNQRRHQYLTCNTDGAG